MRQVVEVAGQAGGNGSGGLPLMGLGKLGGPDLPPGRRIREGSASNLFTCFQVDGFGRAGCFPSSLELAK